MVGNHVHGLFVVNAHGRVKALGRRDVHADDGYFHMAETAHFVGVEIERTCYDRVDIAAHGEAGEEVAALFGSGHGIDCNVVSSRMKNRIQTGEHIRIEP